MSFDFKNVETKEKDDIIFFRKFLICAFFENHSYIIYTSDKGRRSSSASQKRLVPTQKNSQKKFFITRTIMCISLKTYCVHECLQKKKKK